jgi:hypothetical protein
MLSTNVLIYFNDYSDTKQPLKYSSQKLEETVDASVPLLETDSRGGSPEFSGTAYHKCHQEHC